MQFFQVNKLFLVLSLAVLYGCSNSQLKCIDSGNEEGTTENSSSQQKANSKKVDNSKQPLTLKIGVDGSASLLGYLQAPGNPWGNTISALESVITTIDAKTKSVVRVGGSDLEEIPSLQSTDLACFFQGCGPFKPISSNLQKLWDKPEKNQLTILISDLESNANLAGAISKAITDSNPEAIGIAAIIEPFNGRVFGPDKGMPIAEGSFQRPLYMLVTGPLEKVRNILDKSQSSFGATGFSKVYTSLLNDQVESVRFVQNVEAINSQGNPDPNAASVGLNIPISSKLKVVANNEIQTIKLTGSRRFAASTGPTLQSLSSVKYPPGQVILETFDPTKRLWIKASGVSLLELRQQETDFTAFLERDPSSGPQLMRAILPATRTGDAWWFQLSSDPSRPLEPNKTRGLYNLLTTIQSSFFEAQGKAQRPAVALCVAYS